jgi:hypothetical protein
VIHELIIRDASLKILPLKTAGALALKAESIAKGGVEIRPSVRTKREP